jgi:hypothetical protein
LFWALTARTTFRVILVTGDIHVTPLLLLLLLRLPLGGLVVVAAAVTTTTTTTTATAEAGVAAMRSPIE